MPHRELRKRSLTACVLILCACGISGGFVACDGGTFLKGVVLDSADSPVIDAEVILSVRGTTRQVKVRSNDHGVFNVGTLHSPFNTKLSLLVTKQGYRTYEKQFHSHQNLKSIVITMQSASGSDGIGRSANAP